MSNAVGGAFHRSDLLAIQQQILQRLSCQQTIAPSTMPATCPVNLTLKDSKQRPIAAGGKIGEWTVQATCSATGTEAGIKISVNRPGVDPLTKRPWTENTVAKDLFRGVRLCSQLFTEGCPTTHPTMLGFDASNPICCRSNLNQFINVPSQLVTCPVGEDIRFAGHACHQPPRPAGNLLVIPGSNSAYSSGFGEAVGVDGRQGFTAACAGGGAGDVGTVMWWQCCSN
jgi:hypothetical protein